MFSEGTIHIHSLGQLESAQYCLIKTVGPSSHRSALQLELYSLFFSGIEYYFGFLKRRFYPKNVRSQGKNLVGNIVEAASELGPHIVKASIRLNVRFLLRGYMEKELMITPLEAEQEEEENLKEWVEQKLRK